MKKIIPIAFLLFFVITITYAQDVVNPVAVSTTFAPAFATDPINTINGNGLVSFPSLTADHEASIPSNSFVSDDSTGSFDFDLGGTFILDGFSFWNQNNGGPGASGTTGIQGVVVSSSLDGVNYTPIPGSPTTFAQVTTDLSPPETFTFTPVNASFIRFEVSSNYGDTSTGFAEVAFSGVELGIEDNSLNNLFTYFSKPS